MDVENNEIKRSKIRASKIRSPTISDKHNTEEFDDISQQNTDPEAANETQQPEPEDFEPTDPKVPEAEHEYPQIDEPGLIDAAPNTTRPPPLPSRESRTISAAPPLPERSFSVSSTEVKTMTDYSETLKMYTLSFWATAVVFKVMVILIWYFLQAFVEIVGPRGWSRYIYEFSWNF